MTKDQVASALREIGTILELQGENPFKCRAYLNGARTLETSATDLTELVRTNRLGELPGIGDALREKITTLITTGKLPYLEELRSSIPAGLLKGKSKTPLKLKDEKELHKALGLAFIPPELREDSGEIAAAEKDELPDLLTRDQIRGCLHNHTLASDGQDSLSSMAQAAAEQGLEWLGIADHSKSSFQANGLDAKRLEKQIEEIRLLNSKKPKCTLLSGTECDILKDGKLDFPDSLLSELDYVVASVHSGFTSDEKEMTQRIIRAMENPHVTCLGHPTGRLLLEREAYPLNIPKILDAAAATGTWIELNANPWRLDLDWRWWHKARDLGILCCINPDAHKTSHLRFLDFGVTLARKGWLRAQDVVNTRTLSQLRKLL